MGLLTLIFSSFIFTLALGAPGAPATSGSSNLAKDLAVIQQFKQKVIGPQAITKNWTGSDVCNFKGFYCDTTPDLHVESVASVDFNGFGLYGDHMTLDGFFDKLPNVALLHINSNNFTGSLPKDLKALKWLYEIDASSNQLSGPFPRSVLDVNLSFLDLRYNQFSGPIPYEVFKMNLEALFLNDNKFSSSIPGNVGSSPINYLNLAYNQLTGTIPNWIATMPSSIEIMLLGNSLSGPLPCKWTSQNLTLFDAGNNKLSGPVPEDLCKLKNLERLNLSGNYFSGNLGPACAGLAKRKILDVSNNCIQGAKNQKPANQCRSKQ